MKSLTILYEDNHVIAAVKPPGVLSQADASGAPDMLTILKVYVKEKYAKPGDVYIGLVHRLDRPVGGAMVFARTSKAAARLSAQVSERSLTKEYLAVVENGGALPSAGILTDHLLKDDENNVRVVSAVTPGAKYAELSFEKLACAGGFALVRVALVTGRAHQIRVQFASRGHAIWADARYGRARSGADIALWAVRLEFEHPTLRERIELTSKPPDAHPWRALTGKEE